MYVSKYKPYIHLIMHPYHSEQSGTPTKDQFGTPTK